MAKPEGPRTSIQRRTVVAGLAAASSQLLFPLPAFANTKRPTSMGREKLDIERFVEDCVIANKEAEAQAAVKEVLARGSPRRMLS